MNGNCLLITRVQGGVAGNIVVNKGFLKQFGTEDKSGVGALNPNWGRF